MIAKIIFFVFPLLLILLPFLLYRKYKPPYINVWLRLAFDNNARKKCQKDGNEYHTTRAHFLSCHILRRLSRRLRFYLFLLYCILHVCNQNICPADARHQTEQDLVSAHGHCKRCSAIRTSHILDFYIFGIDPGMCNILSIQRI